MRTGRIVSPTPLRRDGRPFQRVDLVARAREWGWRRALYWQLMHALARGTGFHIHYVHVGADRPDLRYRERPQVPPGYSTRLGQREDFLPFVGRLPSLDREFVDEAFSSGDQCSVTFHRGELVSFCFATRTRARVTEQLEVRVPEGFRYVYKSWTHPDHRRRNLSRMGAFVRNATGGVPFEERTISYVETHNYAVLLRNRHPSDRSIQFGYAGWLTLFGRQVPFRTRKAGWIGFEFSRKGQP